MVASQLVVHLWPPNLHQPSLFWKTSSHSNPICSIQSGASDSQTSQLNFHAEYGPDTQLDGLGRFAVDVHVCLAFVQPLPWAISTFHLAFILEN
jgi:hypothetical protein